MDMPKQIGQYRVERLLGEGGMGEVYLAHDDRLDRPTAIKRLVPKDKSAAQQRKRFRAEARITARLDHASIVRVYDVLDEGEATCIVMEYVPGTTLRQRIVEHGPLSVREALRIGLQIADGMAKAHREGVIHRDLKSENVLLHLDGTAKITDFGIAKELGAQTLTEQGKVLGTYTAMSPEQIRGEELKPASDLFSFGILLYEALAGERPFTGRGLEQIVLAITQHQQPPLNTRIPGLPDRLSALVDSLLIKHWSMRPASFRDVIDELKRIDAALDDAVADLKAPPVATGGMADESTEDAEALAANVAEPEHVATPVDPGRAIIVHPAHGTTGQQRALADSGNSGPARVSRRRWLPGIFAAAGVLVAVVLAYALWPGDIDRPEPTPKPLPVPVKQLQVAVLMPEVPSDCPHARDWVANTVRNAMEEPLFRLRGVFVVSEVGVVSRTVMADAVADEILAATITCHPDRLVIEVRRQDASGKLPVPRRTFELDISNLGRSETIQFNVRQLYADFEARTDVPSRGQARPEDLEKFQSLSKAYWHSELPREQALDELEEIRRSSPRFLEAYILAAELLMHRADPGDFDKAWQIMQEAKSIDSDWPPVLSRLFTIALARHDIEEAEKVLKQIEAHDQGAGFTYYLRGLLLENAQDTHGARDAMQTASERHPSWRILYHLAKLNIAVCDIQGAEEVLDRLWTRWPENKRAVRALRGQLQGRLAPGAAAAEYESLMPRPTATETTNQAVNLMNLQRYPEAKALILQVLQEDPEDVAGIYTLAEVEKVLGETDSAYVRFAHVLLQVPADVHLADIMSGRAMALAHQGRFDEARQAIEQALRREDMEIYYSAAAVYAMARDLDEAARWAERALACGYAPEWFHYDWFDEIRQRPQLRGRIGSPSDMPTRP